MFLDQLYELLLGLPIATPSTHAHTRKMDITGMLFPRADDGDNALSNFQYYYYSPSMPAAIIFVALFAITTALHLVQMFTTRTWFMIPFVIGGICESTVLPPW